MTLVYVVDGLLKPFTFKDHLLSTCDVYHRLFGGRLKETVFKALVLTGIEPNFALLHFLTQCKVWGSSENNVYISAAVSIYAQTSKIKCVIKILKTSKRCVLTSTIWVYHKTFQAHHLSLLHNWHAEITSPSTKSGMSHTSWFQMFWAESRKTLYDW